MILKLAHDIEMELICIQVMIIEIYQHNMQFSGHVYVNKEIWNQSKYDTAIDKACRRQRVPGTVFKYDTAAAMPSYQYLSESERGVIVSAQKMGHSIFEVAMKFGF
ncbi:HTH_Tnp_Tc3_2 domain-containing protein [Trichonephila clavipes]|nr:HTH_Tnp_Tc3_2 domain-containing protein [Trichonephila clavipes]